MPYCTGFMKILSFHWNETLGSPFLKCQSWIHLFFVLVKRYRGILGDRQKILYKDLKNITENIHEEYALKSKDFERQFFPYFKLGKSYGNYQFHFLVVKKDYVRNGR